MRARLLIGCIISVMLHVPSVFGETITVDANQLEAASLACTDGTHVFGIRGDGINTSTLLIEKDGVALYYNDEFEDIQHIQSIYCLQNAIVISGTHGSYIGTAAFSFTYSQLTPEKIAITRSLPRIEESSGKTTISIYGDDREGDKETVIKSITFYLPLKAKSQTHAKKVIFLPQVKIVTPTSTHGNLSTKVTCYDHTIETDYTLMAFTDDNGTSFLSLKDLHVSESNGYVSKFSLPLPFVATNSMCLADGTYLFGTHKEKVVAARYFFTANGQGQLELIDIMHAPLVPAISINMPIPQINQ